MNDSSPSPPIRWCLLMSFSILRRLRLLPPFLGGGSLHTSRSLSLSNPLSKRFLRGPFITSGRLWNYNRTTLDKTWSLNNLTSFYFILTIFGHSKIINNEFCIFNFVLRSSLAFCAPSLPSSLCYDEGDHFYLKILGFNLRSLNKVLREFWNRGKD